MSDHLKINVAVTGSNGQLGKELAHIAGEHPRFHFTFLSRTVFPLEDNEKMKSWLEVNPTDYFINCAAYTAVDKAESEKEKAFRINGFAPGYIGSLLEASVRFIQISTDYVFDGNSSIPLSEDAETNPINWYGSSKLQGEKEVMHHHPNSIVIRTSWLYSDYGNNFVKTMMRLMKEKTSLQVVNDQIGSPTYAGDLAGAILKILESDRFKSGIYHYSNEGETSWFEFAREIKNLTDSNCEVLPIPSSGFPTAARRPAYSLMDKSRIKKVYNLAIPDWKTSLDQCIAKMNKQGV